MGKYPYMVVKTHPMAGECSIAGHDMVICESEVYPPFLYGGHIEAKFAAAAWNAFVTAAERLDMDPLELAERLQDGGIAMLVVGTRRYLDDELHNEDVIRMAKTNAKFLNWIDGKTNAASD